MIVVDGRVRDVEELGKREELMVLTFPISR